MKIDDILTEAVKQRLDAKCWKGKHKEGTKIKGGVRVNNCVPNESIEEDEGDCEGLPHLTNELLTHIVQQVETEGAHAIVKSLEWGDGAAEDLLDLIVADLKKHVESHDPALAEEFDLIERNINILAERNQVNAEVIWEDLESLTDEELYVFAVTQPVTEDWQKVNRKDKTSGMSKKAVKAYRREHPGSKLQTAVTTKPSKLKKGSKASKRRKSYCSRSRGQMKMHNISCQKTPDKAICKARRRWNCE